MIESEAVQHRRVEIMHARTIFHRSETRFVGRAVDGSTLMPPPAIQTLKPQCIPSIHFGVKIAELKNAGEFTWYAASLLVIGKVVPNAVK